MPLSVQWISPARNALLLEASFHDATPGIMFSYSCLAYSSAFAVSGELMITLSDLSTRLPPCAHRHQCTQALPSPEAWPSAIPPGVFCPFIALAKARNSSVVFGASLKPAFCIDDLRTLMTLPL